MARKSRWGERLKADPNQSFTMDFQDSDRDGVDDRYQSGPGQPAGEVGQDYKPEKLPPGSTTKTIPIENSQTGFPTSTYKGSNQGFKRRTSNQGEGRQYSDGERQQMQNGYVGFGDIMKQFFNWSPESHDDEGRAMKNAMMGDWMSKFFDSNLSKSMGQYQAGLSKDMMTHQWNLEQMGQSNSRKEEFGYGMRAMDKQYELQNLFANQQHGRDLGMLSATGEQTRKNYKAQGVENRLQSITDNEQERLNIGARGDQERKTIDFSDQIDARKENRQRSRARALARSF